MRGALNNPDSRKLIEYTREQLELSQQYFENNPTETQRVVNWKTVVNRCILYLYGTKISKLIRGRISEIHVKLCL